MDLFNGNNDAMHVWTLEEPLAIVETIMLTNYECKGYYHNSVNYSLIVH